MTTLPENKKGAPLEPPKKVSPLLGLLKRVRNYVDLDTSVNIYKGLIQPHLDYGCVVWDGLDNGLAIKLQRLQNRAARILQDQAGKCGRKISCLI